MQKMGWFGVVRGHSRSYAMSPFDRAHTTSYSTLIEIIFKMWLKIGPVLRSSGHRSESVGKLNSVGIGGLALTRAARDSSPHTIQRLTDPSTVTFILWTEDTMKFLQLQFFF